MSWLPLESNPDVMNKYLQRMGVSEKWRVHDVYGLDSDQLGFLPRPVVAFILLFPDNDIYVNFKNHEQDVIKEKGQKISDKVFFLKQFIENACGAIALIHSVANSELVQPLGDGCLKQYLTDALKLNPEERGNMLKESVPFATLHNDIAVEGQTQVPPENEQVSHHFATFVHQDGCIYELDGDKVAPINHGPTTTETFVEDTAKLLQSIIARDPNEVRFGISVIAPNLDVANLAE